MTPTPLPPITYLQEAVEISNDSPSGLKWKLRPRHHFKSERGWRITNTRDAGNNAGSRSMSGDGAPRYVVKINQVVFPAHRIIYALTHGIDPWPYEVDHIDINPLNNNPSNLRIANRSENASNKSIPTNNTSGVKGVTWCKRTQLWMAQIGKDKKTIFLGRYESIDDATKARKEAEKQYHGEFAPNNDYAQ